MTTLAEPSDQSPSAGYPRHRISSSRSKRAGGIDRLSQRGVFDADCRVSQCGKRQTLLRKDAAKKRGGDMTGAANRERAVARVRGDGRGSWFAFLVQMFRAHVNVPVPFGPGQILYAARPTLESHPRRPSLWTKMEVESASAESLGDFNCCKPRRMSQTEPD